MVTFLRCQALRPPIHKAYRPGMPKDQEDQEKPSKDENIKEVITIEDNPLGTEEEWTKVTRRGRTNYIKSPMHKDLKQIQSFKIHTKNRFTNLDNNEDGDKEPKSGPNHLCQTCNIYFTTKKSLEQHKTSAHPVRKRKIEAEESKDDIIRGLQLKLGKEIKDHKETKKHLEFLQNEYKGCEHELRNSQEEKERLKIKAKDLEAIVVLTKEPMVEQVT